MRFTALPVMVATVAAGTIAPLTASAQDPKDVVAAAIDARAARYGALAQRIWDYAELGYLEERSSAGLQEELRDAGFRIETGVAGIPTAFIASWGAGEPVIGLLAEYDALPGISQDRVPERRPRPDMAAGHACGHHLFGAGSVAAAIATKEWLEASGREIGHFIGESRR